MIPGPDGDQSAAFEANPYTFLRDLQEHGDIVAIDFAGLKTAVLYNLEDIHRVFADKLEHVGQAAIFERLSHATGSGILTNYNWDTWKPRRQRIMKPLTNRAVRQFHERMISIIDSHLDSWPVGEEFELYEAVRNVTLPVVADLLFTEDITPEAIAVIENAIHEIHGWAESDPANTDVDNEPASFRAAIDELDAFIHGVIGRRDPANPGDDMLARLIAGLQKM